MSVKIIYIAGKVTGLPTDEVWLKFHRKQEELEACGHRVINPVHLIQQHNNDRRFFQRQPITGWDEEMRICIESLLKADELHLLHCWQHSRGAVLERDIALRLGMPIVYPL